MLGRAGDGCRGCSLTFVAARSSAPLAGRSDPTSQPTPTAIRPTASGLPAAWRRRRSGAADAFSWIADALSPAADAFSPAAEVVLETDCDAAPMTLSFTPSTAERRGCLRFAACAGLTVLARVLTSSLRLARVSSICSRIWSGSLVMMCPRFLLLRQESSSPSARSARRRICADLPAPRQPEDRRGDQPDCRHDQRRAAMPGGVADAPPRGDRREQQDHVAADAGPASSPAPFPARMADWRSSALASSISWRMSVLRSTATSENSSPTDGRESGRGGQAGSNGQLTGCPDGPPGHRNQRAPLAVRWTGLPGRITAGWRQTAGRDRKARRLIADARRHRQQGSSPRQTAGPTAR